MSTLNTLSCEEQEKLDEIIHGIFSEMASGLNNDGPEAQIDFLLEKGYFSNLEAALKAIK